MFFCPCEAQFQDLYRQNTRISYIRLFHASPGSPAVDVYLNNKPLVRALVYRGFSIYFALQAGEYNIKLYKTGTKENPIVNSNFTLPEKSIYTAAVIGTLPAISLYAIEEPVTQKDPGKVYLRFAHLSPNAPSVDVTAQNSPLFENVSYKNFTEYKAIAPGRYTFNLLLSSNKERVLYVPNIRLLPNRFYTMYAVGLAGATPALQALFPLDGNTYLKI